MGKNKENESRRGNNLKAGGGNTGDSWFLGGFSD